MRHTGVGLPGLLRRLPARVGVAPHIDYRYPCLQLDESAPAPIYRELLKRMTSLAFVVEQATRLTVPLGRALVLDESVTRGQPEAFIIGLEFVVLRADGSCHLVLPPMWGQKLLDRGWATIHPLARYLAGALPPQSLILYAPRDEKDLLVSWKALQAAYWFARGEVDGHPLPDSAW